MTALPGVAEAVLAALLVAFVARSFFGSPPPEPDPVAASAWMLAALLFLACGLLEDTPALVAELLTVAAVVAACEAGWWLRPARGGGGGEGDSGPDGPSPPDWDEFDRARRGWERPRTLA